jgi:large subunit ribosomal protein L32
MPNPKRRHSNTRTRKRRTHDVMTVANTSGCTNCGKPIRSHRVCPFCGYYKGRQVIQIKTKEKKKRA